MSIFDPCVGITFILGQMMLVILPQDPQIASLPSPQRPSSVPTVVVDAGHGGRDAGARRNRLVEKDLTLDIAGRLEKNLVGMGLPVVMTRTEDRFLSLEERAAIANAIDDALFVSIHLNASPGVGPAGIETYFGREKNLPHPYSRIGYFFGLGSRIDPEGENLAAMVHTAMHLQTGSPDRGIRARKFFVLRNTRCPSILVEAGFLNNTFESGLLATPAYRQRIADAVAVGIAAYCRDRANRMPGYDELAVVWNSRAPGG